MQPGGEPAPVALITGAGGGIGRAIALALACEGHAIALVDINAELVEASSAAVAAMGGVARHYVADVSSSADWQQTLAAIEADLGPVTAFANNAGIEGTVAPIDEYPEAVFDQLQNVNSKGVFLGLKYVLKAMRANGKGAVVNTASTSAIRGRAGLAGYVATKHAVLGLTRVAALDMAGTGIRVNAVLPGPVETRMIHAIEAEALAAGVAIKRSGTAQPAQPESVAEVVAFLLSDRAAHVTGAAWVVDAGSTIA